MDRLSALSDHILHKIQSFLPLKLAVQTCVLSKRREKLWTSLPDLTFHGDSLDFTPSTFRNLVAKLLSTREDCNVDEFRISSEWPLDSTFLSSVIGYMLLLIMLRVFTSFTPFSTSIPSGCLLNFYCVNLWKPLNFDCLHFHYADNLESVTLFLLLSI